MGTVQERSSDAEYVVVALSYRGYWKSSGRATQKGIELDARAFLEWVGETYAPDGIVLWGHSLGAAVASSVTVEYLGTAEGSLPIKGLVLEAPISSIKDMLISLYPQKWLPYRYLWPFSWNNWDVGAAMEEMARHNSSTKGKSTSMKPPPILLMSAESDEVVPLWVADQLEDKARGLGLEIQRKNVKGAMHIEGPLKIEGRSALADFIVSRCT
ncbi:Alpha/Beta hydrolase protein [Aspergillus cavernicola]|uniref:Alpha/Beta hydrolase protein n=1 Tax=Aspergillus cavernicola TaxID=176166 RepID=A0ABR4I9F6_9EURO